MPNQSRLVVISGPSGSGKSTVIREILKRRDDFVRSISVTTRQPRGYETPDVHYHFTTLEDFEKGIENDRFAEWAEVHGNYYGTDRQAILNHLNRGHHVLMDIDVNGGENLKALFPDRTVQIFLQVPSLEELRRRLRKRGADDEATIERRLSRFEFENRKGAKYQYQIVNEVLDDTVNKILGIINGVG